MKEHQQLRMELLQEMKQRGFGFYSKKIEQLRTEALEILQSPDPKLLDDDDFWIKRYPTPWWKHSQTYSRRYKGTSRTLLSPILKASLREETANMFVVQSPGTPLQKNLLFRLMFSSYFSNPEALWPILVNVDLAYFVNKTSESSGISRVLDATIGGAGPILLKAMQELNSDLLGAKRGKGWLGLDIGTITQSALNSVPPLFPREYQFVKANIGVPDFVRETMEPKAIGSASIAEAHFAKYRDSRGREQEVVVKFIRPMYAFYFICEADYFLRVVWKKVRKQVRRFPTAQKPLLIRQIRQMLLFVVRVFGSEFNYTQEAQNTMAGHKIYNRPRSHLRSVEVLHSSTEPFPVLVLEKAPGTSLGKVMDTLKDMKDPSTLTAALLKPLTALLETWAQNLFWGSGEFHADMHAGNIMSPNVRELRRLVDRGKTPDLWLIDFGSFGTVDKGMQCCLIDAMLLPTHIQSLADLVPPVDNASMGNEREEPRGFARFFSKFSQLTPRQQHVLNIRASPEETGTEKSLASVDALTKRHNANRDFVEGFIRLAWNICRSGQAARSPEALQKLTGILLDYSSPMDFATLFRRVLENGEDIGSCTYNSIVLFGRGINFVGNLIFQLQQLCLDPRICTEWSLNNLVQNQLMKHPVQLYHYLRKEHVCGAKACTSA
jgi:hypothetical protein